MLLVVLDTTVHVNPWWQIYPCRHDRTDCCI